MVDESAKKPKIPVRVRPALRTHTHGATTHRHGDSPVPQQTGESLAYTPRRPLARSAAAGKTIFLDAFSGIAGDMLVAALVDLGVPLGELVQAIDSLDLVGTTLALERVERSGIVAPRFVVSVESKHPLRNYRSIRELFGRAAITEGARQIACDALDRLARAESIVHGVSVDNVHFHEVGAVDSIVDTLAAAVALDWLGGEVICSPLPIGRGFVDTAHGVLPLPAPATLLCLEDIPTYDAEIDVELVTPTGACLVAAGASQFLRWPTMEIESVGWGAGTRTLADRPNLLRVVMGRATAESLGTPRASHVIIEANLDDLSAELVAAAAEAVFAAGALDVWSTPIQMKKGRLAVTLAALCTAANRAAISNAMLSATSTLGVRISECNRVERPRRFATVETRFGPVSVKVADGDDLPRVIAPEFEDCKKTAADAGVSVREVYEAALQAALLELR